MGHGVCTSRPTWLELLLRRLAAVILHWNSHSTR